MSNGHYAAHERPQASAQRPNGLRPLMRLALQYARLLGKTLWAINPRAFPAQDVPYKRYQVALMEGDAGSFARMDKKTMEEPD